MTIGIFGGRFDPIHNGHLAVAKEIFKQKHPDQIWMLVENIHQWRPIVASAEDRIKMVELAINELGEKKIKVSDLAIRLGGMTETITVMRHLHKQFSKDQFFFICGSDQLENFTKWTHWEELKKEVKFWIVERGNFSIHNVPENCEIIQDPNYIPLEDSATEIRERLKLNLSIKNLVSEGVEKYIIKKRLYK